MTRKQFIESHGATCKNWNWSWSFINEKEKVIIFGAWKYEDDQEYVLIFTPNWEYNSASRKSSGFNQSLKHINLIENKGYKLKIFPMYPSDEAMIIEGNEPAKIKGFKPVLYERQLVRMGNDYFAWVEKECINYAGEIDNAEQYAEGTSKQIIVNYYERNPVARKKCLEHYGYNCQVCNFNFEHVYGALGKDFIHVHHIIPLSEIDDSYSVNPIKDLIPLCPNCHSMIHRVKPALRIEELRKYILKKGDAD